MALLDAAPRRVSAGWTGLLADMSAEGAAGAGSGLLRAFAAPVARADGAPAAAGACWTAMMDLDADFGLEMPQRSGAGDTTGLVEHAEALRAHAAQLSRELMAPQCVDAAGMRCLDPTHGADCSRCTAPPPRGAAESVHLYSQGANAVAGEKLLRRLLLACPEWSDAGAREAAAAAADAEGDAATAACVRARSSPALRKSSMLALCRHWRYKCDVFTPSPFSAAAQAAAAAQAEARAASASAEPEVANEPSAADGSEGQPPSPSRSAEAAAEAAPAEAPGCGELDDAGAEGPEWRCLDDSHPPSCGRCSRPPVNDAAAAACVLRGSRKRLQQNGEKQLRAALCRTPEWRDPAARAAAARRLAAAGAPGTARAVADRDCSALRKLDMLRLCRLWRLRSDVWQTRAEAPPPRQAQPRAPRLPQAAPGAARFPMQMPPHLAALFPSPAAAAALERELLGSPVPPLPAALDVRAVHAYLCEVVAPAVRLFLWHGSIHSAADIAAALPPNTPSAIDAAACKRSAAVVARMHAASSADLARLRAIAAALDAASARAAPACFLGTLAPPLAEGHVHMLRLFAAGQAEHVTLMTSPTYGIGARFGRRPNALELAQIKAIRACQVALQRMGNAMQALLLRARDSDAATYLAAGCGILDLITELSRLTVINELGRAEWAASRPCSWDSRFFDSVLAVGGETVPHPMLAAFEATAPMSDVQQMQQLPHFMMPQYPSAAVGLAPFYSMT